MITLGVDFGDKRVGFSVCDREEQTAVSIRTVMVRGAKHAAKVTADFAKAYSAEKIVVGMPVRQDGYRGERCEKTDVFLGFLKEECPLPAETFDERFTTVQAHDLLYDAGLDGRAHRAVVDALSAQIILQSYLDARKEREQV